MSAPPLRMTQQHPQAPAPSNDSYISPKITKINGRDKVIDFNSYLSMATVSDYAMVHGCGGSDHARNSTIGVTLCDYSKGKGDKSVTVKYSIDVADIAILLQAAMQARLGGFQKAPSMPVGLADDLTAQVNSWQACPVMQDGSRVIPRDALNRLLQSVTALRNAMVTPAANGPLFSYTKEKNNPYKKRDGLVPVSSITISYSPVDQRGNPSNYPWYVRIDNFDAPLAERSNGATAHKSSQATNKKSAFINLSLDDFAAAMVAVDSHIRLWEHRTLPVMEEAFRRIANQKAQEAASDPGANQNRRAYG